MKLETEQLIMIPIDSQSAQIKEAQNYDNGPQIANHVKELEDDPTLYGWGSWLVLRKSDGLIIGDAGFKGRPDANQQVEVGYGFLESEWGKGYATEAVGRLLDWAFYTKAVRKVTAETDLNNIGSIRVLEKLWMKKTKTTADMIYWEKNKESIENDKV